MTDKTTQLRRFQVRDVSAYYDEPAFDVIFHDDENGVERYSIEMWDTHKDAAKAADLHEARADRPTDWDVYRTK